ncbi:uncharacterized protein LOC131052076 isoform X1 [Cryptomeria japonica]|uniref:uncharacterized protein LOC131052076 isoform X1 n=1 Tax=Cryptomeria japonica TaxID=3369 RepID=UPI0027DA19C4|nr:uncharacterized protein LOC131052076 isoform X1 [Cryptomeria japonica]
MVQESLFEELYNELFKSSDFKIPTTKEKSQRMQKIIQSLDLLQSEFCESSFNEFMHECSKSMLKKAKEAAESVAVWIVSKKPLIEGLLHIMVFRQSNIDLAFGDVHNEASIVKLAFLFRLFLLEPPDILHLMNNPHSLFIVQAGFQLFLDLFGSKLMPLLCQDGILWDGAWKLLEDLQQLNEDEWDACLATVLHQIISFYLSKGPTVLQKAPMKFLIQLLAKPCFARSFLESITLFPDSSNVSADKIAIHAALQIFETVYKSSPLTIVTNCASKLVDPYTDSALVRLECLSLLGKIRLHMASGIIEHGALQTWPAEAIYNIMTSVLSDSSVRVRRSAIQLLLQIEPPEVDEKELLYTVFLKTRDQDKRVKLLAFQRLIRFPMQLLYSNFEARDWKLIFQQALANEGSHVYHIAKDLLLKFLSSDSMPPSRRLKMLDFAHKDNYKKYGKFIGNHIAEIFEMEVMFLDLYSCDDENQNTET